MTETIACRDLLHSVYLGPTQVRTCCKRFFVDGKQKGDVVLLDTHLTSPSSKAIMDAKKSLYKKINAGEENDCSGCPYLEKKNWGQVENLEVRHLSFEYHSVCNMKCEYCSDTYYGGRSVNYDVDGLITELNNHKALDSCSTVVWGGGEPTVNKQFIPLIERISAEINPSQRIFTNALQFKPELLRLLETKDVNITCSIDAGSEAVFKKIRGYKGENGLEKVLNNLKVYAAKAADKITLKYIITHRNFKLEEVNKFIEKIKKYDLLNCNFQISINYKFEDVESDMLFSALIMYGLLKKCNINRIFLDDLLWERMSGNYTKNKQEIDKSLKDVGCSDLLANPFDYPEVVVWGAGQIANNMMNKSTFFKNVEIKYFVDSNNKKIGELFNEREIKSPDAVVDSEYPIYIASTQYYPDIVKQLHHLGVGEQRIISSVVI